MGFTEKLWQQYHVISNGIVDFSFGPSWGNNDAGSASGKEPSLGAASCFAPSVGDAKPAA